MLMNRSLKAVKKILLLCLHSVLGQRGGVGNVLFSMGNELYNTLEAITRLHIEYYKKFLCR